MVDAVPRLKQLHLRLTGSCNLRCPHCYAAPARLDETAVQPVEYWSDIVRAALSLGLESVTLSGGEPLVYAGFTEVVESLESIPIHLRVETNGSLLQREVGVLSRSSRLDRLAVSLYFEGLQLGENPPLWPLVLDLHRQGLPVSVQVVAMPEILAPLLSWLDRALDIGVPIRLILGHNGLGRARGRPTLAPETMIGIWRKYRDRDWLYCELPALVTGGHGFDCGWKSYRAEILPDGTLTPCAAIAWSDAAFRVGRVTPGTLAEVWNEAPLLRSVRALRRTDFGGACGTCPHFDNCAGSCRAVALGHGEGLYSAYPLCDWVAGHEAGGLG